MALIILVAGCVSSGKTKTQIVSKDMLKIKSIDVFPSKEVQPGDAIIIRMEVENVGQDSTYLLVDKDASKKTDASKSTNPAWNGDYLLIDHCSTLYNADTDTVKRDADFQILSGGTCIKFDGMYSATDSAYENPLIPLVKDSGGNPIGAVLDSGGAIKMLGTTPVTACYLKIPPGQSHTFQWSLKAPVSEKIAEMTHKCMFKFQTAYAAEAITNTYVYFADPLEVAQRMYTQKDMTLAGDNIASYGPIAVNFVPAEPQPIPARTGGENWTVFLNVKNVGEGIADLSAINLGLPKKEDGTNIVSPGEKCLMGGNITLKAINDQLRPVETVHMLVLEVTDPQTVLNAFGIYLQYCTMNDPYGNSMSNDPACSDANKAEVNKYVTLSGSTPVCTTGFEEFCAKEYPKIKTDLEDARQKLLIQKQSTSSIACDLTIPEGITILSPYRFVTTADYSYNIRQDIQITTKPVKERA